MDIRKKIEFKDSNDTSIGVTVELNPKFKTGLIQTADAKLLLPPGIQGKLSALTTKYGIPFDLDNIGLDGKMAENVKALRTIVDMVEGDSKLLPEMLKLIKRLMKSEISLAKFHRGCTTAAIQHQEKLDKVTSDIFLKMAGYGSKSTKLEHRTNVRNDIKTKRTEAYSKYYKDTVYGEEVNIIDAEYELLESNRKVLGASKVEKLKLNSERKQKISEYVQSAYKD